MANLINILSWMYAGLCSCMWVQRYGLCVCVLFHVKRTEDNCGCWSLGTLHFWFWRACNLPGTCLISYVCWPVNPNYSPGKKIQHSLKCNRALRCGDNFSHSTEIIRIQHSSARRLSCTQNEHFTDSVILFF